MRKPYLFAAMLLLVLGFSVRSSAWFIAHAYSSLNPAISPEQFRGDRDGTRPGPGNPPLPVTVELLPLPPTWPPAMVEAVGRAVKKWDRVPGSALRFEFVVPGAGADFDPDWRSRYRAEDGRNTIEFVLEGWDEFWSPNVLARTEPHLAPDGRIKEADIFLNAVNFRWIVFEEEGLFSLLVDNRWADVEAVVTHEMGHVAGLGHSQHSWASMWDLVGLADTRARHLTSDDRDGLRALYPVSAADASPPSIWAARKDNFSTPCGMESEAELLNSAKIQYMELSNPYLVIRDPPAAGDTEITYCLFGSGFDPDRLADMDLAREGVPQNAVVNIEYIGPNFVRATIMNDAGGFPPLAPGAYELTVTQNPGGTGELFHGLFVNPVGNRLPKAVITPAEKEIEAGTRVKLSAAGSSDPDDDPHTYQWTIIERPPKATAAALDSSTAETTRLYAPRPGIYVVRLTVNDGKIDSPPAQAVIRAAYGVEDRGGDKFHPLGCGVMPDAPGKGAWPWAAMIMGTLMFIARVRSAGGRDRLQGRGIFSGA